jgi:hypothetical protein
MACRAVRDAAPLARIDSVPTGTPIASYTYAANGNRITETGGGAITAFYYNDTQIIETRQGSTVTDQYVYNIDYVNDVLLQDSTQGTGSGNLGMTASGLNLRLFAQHDANFDVTPSRRPRGQSFSG